MLRSLVEEIHWLDRSAFVSASFGPRVPRVRHALVSALVESEEDRLSPRPLAVLTDADRRVAVAFAPEDGTYAHDWARRRGTRLLASTPAITAEAADKLDVLEILAEAAVDTPEFVRVPAERRAPVARYWTHGWDALVVQRRENNLIGEGTRLVRDVGELQRCLDDWQGRELRLGRYVDGPSVTVTACVAADRTVVSAVSHQLVGLKTLASAWGSHCGNQLLGEEDLPAGAHARAREAAWRVGERLRERGYLGVFGLDAVLDGDRVLVIEVNPRFQTVVSLVHAAEEHAGLLPCLGLHVLAHLLPTLPTQTVHAQVPRLSQLVVHAERAMQVTALPTAGRYRLDSVGRLARVGEGRLAELPEDHALVWAQNRLGALVGPGDELALIQLGERVADVAAAPVLHARALAWVAAVTASIAGRPLEISPS